MRRRHNGNQICPPVRTPKAALGRQIAGYALLAALYAGSMGLYALLLAWHWGR